MATYGRKNRGLLSAFSVFQDEKDKPDGRGKRSGKCSVLQTCSGLTDHRATAYSRLTTKSIGREPSQHDLLAEDDSIDELSSALLDDTSEDLMRASTQSHASLANGSYSASSNVKPTVLNKPLPPPPQDLSRSEPSPSRSALTAPMQNATNAKVFSRDRKAFKRSISHPIQQIPHPSNNEQLQRTPTSGYAVNAFDTTTGAADLSNKISNLMTAANSDALETPPQHKDDTKWKVDGKPRRLQRGKDVFAKAGRAIADRFSSSEEKSARRGLYDSNLLNASNDSMLDREPDLDDDANRKRLNRRIAEGTNLSNPKIQSLTGDGNVPRKPLPVYESMKKLGLTDASMEDPFANDHHTRDGGPRHRFSGLHVDFSKRKTRPTSMQEPLIFQDEPKQLTADVSSINAEQTSRFSETISGLAQHPDVEFFSSSPIGYSTPRIRLEPAYAANGKKRLTTVQSSTTSLLDFSFEDNNDECSADEIAIPPSTKVDKSLSLKRKTAKDDLRTVAKRPSKKSKKTPIISREDMILASGIGKLDTQETGALGPNDPNKKLGGLGRGGSKDKGLSIFDTGKMKEAKPVQTEAAKKLRRRQSKRTSIPRPVGRSPGRDRRASSALMTRSKSGDVMDADELQLDLSDYNVGAKKR